MNLDDFKEKSIKEKLLYDFTNTNGCNKKYDEEDTIKKFLIYKAVVKNITIEDLCSKEDYKELIDPDSKSPLLQELYKSIFFDNNKIEKDYMTYMYKNEKYIWGDSMISAITPLCQYFNLPDGKYMEHLKEDKDKSKKQTKWTTYYSCKEHEFLKDTITKEHEKHVYNFIRLNHTLGNFIPVPNGFNVARAGTGAVDDNWFLTMRKIKEYRPFKQGCIIPKSISELLHCDVIANTIKWLDSYGDYDTFVKKNYLDDYEKYLKDNDLIKSFTWKNGNKIINKNNYTEFFKIMNTVILNRSLRMLIKLYGDKTLEKSEVQEVFDEFEVDMATDLEEKLID